MEEQESRGEGGDDAATFHHRSYYEQQADIFADYVRSDRMCNETGTRLEFLRHDGQIECMTAYDQAWWCGSEWLWPDRIECTEHPVYLIWECAADKPWLFGHASVGLDCDTLNHAAAFCPTADQCVGAFDLSPLAHTLIVNTAWTLVVLCITIIVASVATTRKQQQQLQVKQKMKKMHRQSATASSQNKKSR